MYFLKCNRIQSFYNNTFEKLLFSFPLQFASPVLFNEGFMRCAWCLYKLEFFLVYSLKCMHNVPCQWCFCHLRGNVIWGTSLICELSELQCNPNYSLHSCWGLLQKSAVFFLQKKPVLAHSLDSSRMHICWHSKWSFLDWLVNRLDNTEFCIGIIIRKNIPNCAYL